MTHIVWFRHDLRVTDHLALSAACEDPSARVIAVYIATPQQWKTHNMAPRQADLIYTALQGLQQALAERGIPLVYQQCPDFAEAGRWLVEFCHQEGAVGLFYHAQYEYNEQCRDQWVRERLSTGVACHIYHDSLLLAPGTVVTGQGGMFKVFTPFRQAFIRRLATAEVCSLPAPKRRDVSQLVVASTLGPFDYPRQPQTFFPASEAEAIARLRHFCREQVVDYSELRNQPSIKGTSQLSAYLALGLLSPRQCFNRLQLEAPGFLDRPDTGAFCWFNELIWREFYRHLLVAYPSLCRHRPFIDWTDRVVWRNDPSALQAWQKGETGYPIVDAAMRQLNGTGWMHNRLRMIVASFLVKDLLIDWRHGERYFMLQLTDGDLAANNGGWQWAASTGSDAVPYFRIFNPTTQGKRFDPDGQFILTWLPELKSVPLEWIHEPHRWAERQGVLLSYPRPLVDHAVARQQTLAAFAMAKQGPAKVAGG